MLNRKEFPFFKELTHIKVDVEELLKVYQTLKDRKNEQSEFRFAEIRSELAKSFPFKENNYDYVAVTDIDPSLRDTAKTASPLQMMKMVRDGTAPALDDRNYTQLREDVPDYMRVFLSQFLGKVSRVRFATLKPLATIYEHIDNNVTHTARVHVPLITDEFNLFGVRHKDEIQVKHLEVGHVYFVNTAVSHFVINSSKTVARTHLVINLNSLEDILRD